MTNKIVLLCLIIISVIAKNKPMTYGGIIVLSISLINNDNITSFIKNHSFKIGLTLLITWILIPFVDDSKNFNLKNVKNYFDVDGIVSLISGFLVVIIASKGVHYLNDNISVLVGIITGSIIGVTFFDGIPVGMLTGAGVAYIMMQLLKLFSKKL